MEPNKSSPPPSPSLQTRPSTSFALTTSPSTATEATSIGCRIMPGRHEPGLLDFSKYTALTYCKSSIRSRHCIILDPKFHRLVIEVL